MDLILHIISHQAGLRVGIITESFALSSGCQLVRTVKTKVTCVVKMVRNEEHEYEALIEHNLA
jgi:hypothetical protein